MNNQEKSENLRLNNPKEADKAIIESIKKFNEEFKSMPYNFFYEEDIRARLFNILRDMIKYQIEIKRGRFGTNNCEKKILINPVKSEYSQARGFKNRYNEVKFDIVILDEDKEEDFYLLPCQSIIEIKYSLNKHHEKVIEHIDDIKKIMNYFSQSKNVRRVSLHFDLYKGADILKINKWYKNVDIKFEQLPNDLHSLPGDSAHIFYIQSDGVIYYAKKKLNV